MLLPSSEEKGINILNQQELMAYAADHSEAGRQRLAKAVSDFFHGKHLNDHEKDMSSEILMNLIRQAEVDLRGMLAEMLALEPNVPREAIVFLANDDISVAKHILIQSQCLHESDLLFVISSKSYQHWQAIAKRPSLSPAVTDKLIDTGDFMTVMNLIENQQTQLQKPSLKKMFKVATRSERLQAPLMRRPEIDNELAIDLYMVVSSVLRVELTQRFDIPATLIERAADGMIHELTKATQGQHDVSPEMMSLAKKFNDSGDISPALMIRTLRRGQIGFFLALLAEKSGLPPEQVTRLLEKDGGKHLVVPCRLIGMMKSEFASIYMLSRGIGGEKNKIIDQNVMAAALRAFDGLKDHDIQKIMSSWRKNPALI